MLEYADPLRLKYSHLQELKNKRYVPARLERDFFKSKFLVIEEKIDGSQIGLTLKNNYPYAQGNESHIPEFDKRVEFTGLWDWINENRQKVLKTKGHLVFGEWAKVMHNIYYPV